MITREILDNGLTLITETMSALRSVAVGVWVKTGSRHERPEQGGISHFIEHMVFKGTKTRSAERIAAEVDSIGGYMDAFTAKEYASFHLKVLDEHLPLAVEILGDVVQNPLFDPEEMTKEKKVITEEINMVEDTPDDLVMELFCEAFWPDHPLGRPILGTKTHRVPLPPRRPGRLLRARLPALEPGDRGRRPPRPREDARARGAPLLRAPHGGPCRRAGAPRGPPSPPSRARSASSSRCTCASARAALPQTHPDRYVSFVLNTVLGGSMSSRLFQNVREKRGLVYSISSGVTAYSDAGLLSIYAGTSRDSLPEVIRLTLEELRRLCADRIPDEELRRAKDHIKGGLVLSLESTGARMSHLARQEIYFGRQLAARRDPRRHRAGHARTACAASRARLFRERVSASVLGNLDGWRPRAKDLVV